MTVDISRNTWRLLTQVAAVNGLSADEAAEQILSAFLRDVVVSGGEKIRDQLVEMGYLCKEGRDRSSLER